MLIIHRCTTCKHPDYWRDNTGTTAGDTVDGEPVAVKAHRTCCNRSSWGPSETAPQWKALTLELVTEVLPPGDKAGGKATTCDCDECWALWKQETGQTRKPRHLTAVPTGG